MTISKKRLDKIAVELAKEMPPFDICLEPYAFHKYFAHALLKRVEAESEVVCTRFQHEDTGRNTSLDDSKDAEQFTRLNPRWFECGKLIALPLVE
jgi:hypothetical protein